MTWFVDKLSPLIASHAELGLDKAKALYLKFNGLANIAEEVYKGFVTMKEITRVEDLPQEKKRQLWDESKGAIDPKKTDAQNKRRRITYCRAAYLIEVVLKKES